MMSEIEENTIRKKIGGFLTPEKSKSHGRAIYAKEAKECGLNIEIKLLRDKTWSKVYELYYRINNLLNTTPVSKLIESKDSGFIY